MVGLWRRQPRGLRLDLRLGDLVRHLAVHLAATSDVRPNQKQEDAEPGSDPFERQEVADHESANEGQKPEKVPFVNRVYDDMKAAEEGDDPRLNVVEDFVDHFMVASFHPAQA